MDFKNYKQLPQDWALVFRNKLFDIPDSIEIHSDFLQNLSKDEFEKAFRFLRDLFYQMFTDASKDPQSFGLSSEEAEIKVTAAESGAVFRHMQQLYLLFKSGELSDDCLNANTYDIKKSHINTINSLIPIWSGYGFRFSGLIDGKVKSQISNFNIYYPDNPSVIRVLYLVAKKASDETLFKQWNYRLLAEDFGTYSYYDVYINFYDSLHRDEERKFIEAFHKTMSARGYFTEHYPGRGGGHISDFKNTIKDPYYFDVRSYGEFGMFVSLRIRNVEKCFPYLKKCSERIINNFRTSVPGCGNLNCGAKIRYMYEGKEIQRCCVCCGTAWDFEAHIDDIPHYINLVELGVKK